MISSRLLKTGINNMSAPRIPRISRDSRVRDEEWKLPRAKLNFSIRKEPRGAHESLNISQNLQVLYKEVRQSERRRREISENHCTFTNIINKMTICQAFIAPPLITHYTHCRRRNEGGDRRQGLKCSLPSSAMALNSTDPTGIIIHGHLPSPIRNVL